MARIALAEMVEQLRVELRDAVAAGEGRDLRFEVLEITLEAQVEVTKEASGTGKLGFWLFSEVEAGGSVGRADVQKVIVRMKPEQAPSKPIHLRR